MQRCIFNLEMVLKRENSYFQGRYIIEKVKVLLDTVFSSSGKATTDAIMILLGVLLSLKQSLNMFPGSLVA